MTSCAYSCSGAVAARASNTDKSNAFERESKVDAKPVTGSDHGVGTNNGTPDSRIKDDNVRKYRQRVERMRSDSS